MSFSYIPYDFVFRVRSLIPDTNPAKPIFSDEEIIGFGLINQSIWQSSMSSSYTQGTPQLPATPSNVYRAAAVALNVLAGNSARLSAITQLLDVKLNNQVADQLRKTAQMWLDFDDNSGAFVVYEQVCTDWAFRDRWLAQLQRQTGGGFFS